MQVREMPAPQVGPITSFGTYGDSLNLMKDSWEELDHVFSVASPLMDNLSSSHGRHAIQGPRPKQNLLRKFPVDMLVVECGSWQCPKHSYVPFQWELCVHHVEAPLRPKFIIEVWPPNSLLWEHGPAGKGVRVRWEEMGYLTKMQVVDSQHCGGAIVQPRAIIVRDRLRTWEWAPYSSLSLSRPMQNLLTPKGLRPRRKFDSTGCPDEWKLPLYNKDPMPGKPGGWIMDGDGPRKLLFEETGRGLGLPKTRLLLPTDLNASLLQNTTSVFHWEYVSQCLLAPFVASPPIVASSEPIPVTDYGDLDDDTPDADWPDWKPPDMTPGGEWHRARIRRLKYASSFYENSTIIFNEGVEMLERHRQNYDDTGPAPTRLQLLWWEFPESQWEEIRTGGSMNFLTEPAHQILPNSPMSEEELKVAEDFVDELVALGVLRPPADDHGEPIDVVTNAPLFTVPKPGQPGQYRCIADMLKGGQNASVGSDPVVLPRASHILDELYYGGYSAIFDFSKYFYNFPTRAEDRKYLGMLHPRTLELLAYFGLPMGGGNSPAVAGRGGEAFLRLVRESHHLFQGTPSANCWWTGFSPDGTYDPRKGYGYILTNSEGLAVKVWGFVDDFKNHAPTKRLIYVARDFFMDVACRLGFLCHPKKCPPPSQCVKFIGFEFDTKTFPVLRIPLAKRERSLAIVEYLMASPIDQTFSRLSLAVSTGILQSLVEATPNRIGATYLRKHYDTLHPPGMGPGLAPYCTKTVLPEPVRDELRWWSSMLRSTKGRHSRMLRSATLIPNWGDGSGTGTGGTLGLPDVPLQMWQGQWSPVVYSFTSNWKELKTLHLTLLHLQEQGGDSIRSTTVFYFTDNSTTYWIAQAGSSPTPRLHSLIWQIKCLELDLGIQLQVVHVPGVVMIQQGSDALSRGVWVTPFQAISDQRQLTAAVFAPLTPDYNLIESYIIQYSLCPTYTVQHWNTQWVASDLLDRFTVWFPPPELARQAITFMLSAWVQRPTTTSALFFIPRVIPGCWFGLCRHIQELAPVSPRTFALVEQPLLPIPIIVLYLGPHVRQLPNPMTRLDKSPPPTGLRFHKTQAEFLRRLPPSTLQPPDGA